MSGMFSCFTFFFPFRFASPNWWKSSQSNQKFFIATKFSRFRMLDLPIYIGQVVHNYAGGKIDRRLVACWWGVIWFPTCLCCVLIMRMHSNLACLICHACLKSKVTSQCGTMIKKSHAMCIELEETTISRIFHLYWMEFANNLSEWHSSTAGMMLRRMISYT